jgi:L-asparaginase
MSLRIIATGGTFDKHYDELTGMLGFADSHLPAVLARTRMTIPVELEQLPLLDSLDMKDEDRQRVLASCRAAGETAIVIIHGTDTMRETAGVLGEAALDKTIVLTGAMIPYEIANSDALFNLGCATGVAQSLPAGVYVAMNGQVFTWDNVTKNRAAGVFQPL